MSTLLTPDEWIARYDKGGGGGPQDPFQEKAFEIWRKTPTPLFDEFMSKRKATEYYRGAPGQQEDETLFHEYVKKLIIKYPTNPPSDIRKGVYPRDCNGCGQEFAAFFAVHYMRFEETEKALTLLQTYKSPWHGELLSRAGLRHILFETYYNHTAPAREEARKVAEAARIAAEEARLQAEYTARVAAEEKAKNAALIAMYDL